MRIKYILNIFLKMLTLNKIFVSLSTESKQYTGCNVSNTNRHPKQIVVEVSSHFTSHESTPGLPYQWCWVNFQWVTEFTSELDVAKMLFSQTRGNSRFQKFIIIIIYYHWKFSSKNTPFGAGNKSPILEKFRGKIEILSMISFSNLQVSVAKLQLAGTRFSHP